MSHREREVFQTEGAMKEKEKKEKNEEEKTQQQQQQQNARCSSKLWHLLGIRKMRLLAEEWTISA